MNYETGRFNSQFKMWFLYRSPITTFSSSKNILYAVFRGPYNYYSFVYQILAAARPHFNRSVSNYSQVIQIVSLDRFNFFKTFGINK